MTRGSDLVDRSPYNQRVLNIEKMQHRLVDCRHSKLLVTLAVRRPIIYMNAVVL
ncbi:uncharacterized protein PHALS_07253 [Plasmopara halstedii]|uniref:Uncharacterized protein n=1 Tax=Plasmopara halstedii TaxID=4781 RepID=A0A0P1B570_PLAHL|nr:uncharacterized protein PHALS_07253 [Plasmopara halstedii]CEG49490.1 hypothetical protein PHALS_07253 [Plasmopara halstedii]|eukprot:XP_024585859.1 hypothetical protein PHALS_07253 [Plasmopara halstedii]